jgi:hypothetical protein
MLRGGSFFCGGETWLVSGERVKIYGEGLIEE